MGLELADKQFLRSVADLVVNNPELAKQFFNSPKIDGMNIFDPLLPLIEFLKAADEPIPMEELIELIKKISDSEIKEIFITALNMSQKDA
ncbi:helicase [Vibrio cholerae]|uniref:helicase n=1 Tax=Vibrio cholerae TaxID=666 RepID=UPI001159F053|nr:helicase [Vibrio cholerae]TQO96420.1 helicase [Vibrio cholerae]TQP80227.1 helicase [Vibrio cholerae]